MNAVLVLNKVDIIAKEKLLGLSAQINAAGKFKETFMISALTGQNIEDFYKYLADNLPVSPWYYPEEQMSDMPLKLLAAEIVREKLFLYLRQELPYELTVEPELWERREDGSVRAEMTIYVKRDNQKTIVLGRSGEMIKKSGSPRVVKSKMNWTSVSIFSFLLKYARTGLMIRHVIRRGISTSMFDKSCIMAYYLLIFVLV